MAFFAKVGIVISAFQQLTILPFYKSQNLVQIFKKVSRGYFFGRVKGIRIV